MNMRHIFSGRADNDTTFPMVSEKTGRGKSLMLSLFVISLFIFLFGINSADAGTTLYLPDNASNTVSVVDGNTLAVKKTIAVGKEPYGVAVSPDGRTIFITNLGDDSVSVIDANTDQVVETIAVGDAPFGVAMSPNGRFAFVANAGSASVSVIRVDTRKVIGTVPVGDCPHGVVFQPNGARLYVTNYCSANVTVINAYTREVAGTIPVGAGPHGICVHPAGGKIYVANVFSDAVSVISISSQSVIGTIPTGGWPFSAVVDPSGKSLYVTNHKDQSVSVVNTSSHITEGVVTVGFAPHGIDVDESGSRVYVANEGASTVSVIDTASRAVVATISGAVKPVAFGNFVADDLPGLPLPSGEQSFAYSLITLPVLHKDPGQSKPFAVGPLAQGAAVLSPRVQLNAFSGPVDIYLGLYAPAIHPDILLLRPDLAFQPLSSGPVPWRKGVTGPVDEALLGDIPMSTLPPSGYTVGVYVTPAGSLDSAYLWTTDFQGQYSLDAVSNTLVTSFGGDGAFAAVMMAMDKGYSLRQIADAAMSSRLEISGDIREYTGAVETPEEPAPGLIAASSPKGIKESTVYMTLDDLRARARELGDGVTDEDLIGLFTLSMTLSLVESGYSFEEITEGIMFGAIKIEKKCCRENDTYYVYTLADDNGGYLPPAKKKKKEGVFHDVDCTGFDFDGDGTPDLCDSDDDNDGVDDSVDCSTLDAGVYPGKPEICEDGIDQNCDGLTDNAPCVCNPAKGLPQSCGEYCIPAGAECCEPGAYCDIGWTCFYAPKLCCEDGFVPCGEGSRACVLPGYEQFCEGSFNAVLLDQWSSGTPWQIIGQP